MPCFRVFCLRAAHQPSSRCAIYDFISIHVFVNDDMNVSVWQDVRMEQPPAESQSAAEAQSAADGPAVTAVEPLAVRTVDDVDVLKAMADPTRLAILAALMKSRRNLPVMSVKELAAELGEPQTKLYRHVRQLEAAGLIRVASTRMVSGILEQRYQASQRDLALGRGMLKEHAEESVAALQVLLDRFRDGFAAAFLARQRSAAELPDDEAYRVPALTMTDLRISPAKAAELTARLKEITDELNEEQAEDPGGVRVNLLIGWYLPAENR
jgi:DNA-binding transcriptional ArsR family regulator